MVVAGLEVLAVGEAAAVGLVVLAVEARVVAGRVGVGSGAPGETPIPPHAKE